MDTIRRDQGDLIARGRAIAEAFDWSRIGRRILDVFERAARPPAQLTDLRAKAAA